MATVYILYSKSADSFYTGSCKDLQLRLEQHRSKEFPSAFTSKYNDWELFLSIENLEYATARSIEKHIKKMKSKKYILNLKKYPEMILRLIEKYN